MGNRRRSGASGSPSPEPPDIAEAPAFVSESALPVCLRRRMDKRKYRDTVSYTHLTLPTKA